MCAFFPFYVPEFAFDAKLAIVSLNLVCQFGKARGREHGRSCPFGKYDPSQIVTETTSSISYKS